MALHLSKLLPHNRASQNKNKTCVRFKYETVGAIQHITVYKRIVAHSVKSSKSYSVNKVIRVIPVGDQLITESFLL